VWLQDDEMKLEAFLGSPDTIHVIVSVLKSASSNEYTKLLVTLTKMLSHGKVCVFLFFVVFVSPSFLAAVDVYACMCVCLCVCSLLKCDSFFLKKGAESYLRGVPRVLPGVAARTHPALPRRKRLAAADFAPCVHLHFAGQPGTIVGDHRVPGPHSAAHALDASHEERKREREREREKERERGKRERGKRERKERERETTGPVLSFGGHIGGFSSGVSESTNQNRQVRRGRKKENQKKKKTTTTTKHTHTHTHTTIFVLFFITKNFKKRQISFSCVLAPVLKAANTRKPRSSAVCCAIVCSVSSSESTTASNVSSWCVGTAAQIECWSRTSTRTEPREFARLVLIFSSRESEIRAREKIER